MIYMENNKDIPQIIFSAIDTLRNSFGGTDVKLLSDKMYRRPPDESSPAGKLGVKIEVMGIKAFLGCESMAEQISVYGQSIADEYVYRLVKDAYPEKFDK